MTTIAWCIIHLAAWTEVYLDWTFGDAVADLNDYQVPGSCAGGVAEVGVLRDLRRGEARRQPPPPRSGPTWWLPVRP